MFENMHHTDVADQFKRLIRQVRPLGDHEIVLLKRRALAAVQAFEGCAWRDWLLGEAVQRAGPGRIVLLPDGTLAYESGADRPGEAVETLLAVLEDYLSKAGCEISALPPDLPLLTIKEAAIYLGVAENAIKHWVYRSGHLIGLLRGKMLFFSQEELDRVKAEPPQDGRPRTAG